MFERLRRKIRKRLPNIRDGLIAAAIFGVGGAGVAELASKISEWAHRGIKDLTANLIGAAVGAALVAIWLFREPIRQTLGPPRPTGNRIAIYIAKFKGDKSSETLQGRMEATIRKDFGDTVEVFRVTLRPPPPDTANAEAEAAFINEQAQQILQTTTGDILAWGKLIDVGNGSCTAQFVSAAGTKPPDDAFEFRSGALIEEKFSTGLGSAIADLSALHERCAEDAQTYIVPELTAITRRIDNLIGHLPKCVQKIDCGRILNASGRVWYHIGYASGENGPLERAIELHTQAQEVFRRASDSSACAEAKVHLAEAHYYLGIKQDGIHLAYAEETIRQVIDEATGTGNRNLLAVAIGILGKILPRNTDNLNKIVEAIALLNTTLEMFPADEDPERWSMNQARLGHALRVGGELTDDVTFFERSALAFERALERRSEKEGLSWGLIMDDLGDVYTMWGREVNDHTLMTKGIYHLRLAAEALKEFPLDAAIVTASIATALADVEMGRN